MYLSIGLDKVCLGKFIWVFQSDLLLSFVILIEKTIAAIWLDFYEMGKFIFLDFPYLY